MSASALYRGVVVHARRRPKRHRLRYRIFQLLLDLDDLEALSARCRLFSLRRWNLFSFDPADHLGPGAGPLRGKVAALLSEAGLACDGPVRLLCMPRVLGHAFNPISVYFCHAADGGLTALLYEVNNTFGERHVYVLPVEPGSADAPWIEQGCEKRFFVSPFMPMALDYRFQVRRPGSEVSIRVQVSDAEGLLLSTSFEGRGEPITDRSLLRAWLGAPLLSLKVLGSIHWEALWIWGKGVPLQRREPVAAMGVTLGRLA